MIEKVFMGFRKGVKKCPQCGETLEILQTKQWACKKERILFQCSDISDKEMIEWFT